MSARSAERVALDVYSMLYGSAEDVSILQVSMPVDQRWVRADIIAGECKWIDVKNARRSFSSPGAYSEHCVPEMKMDRSGQDVTISAFLSPYMGLSELKNDATDSLRDPVVWIGETRRSEFERLKEEFPLLNGGSRHSLPSRLPPWLFDYPEECYSLRNEALAILRNPSFPWSGAHLPTGAYILGGQVPPGRTREVARESIELAGRIERMGLSRPVLFLHILDRFCWAVRESKPFPALAFRDILWPSMAKPDPITSHETSDIRGCPLAVNDPLETVRELVDVLETVAQVCGTRSLSFDEFRLAGIGILQGRRRRGGWMTLLAYCGGWTRTDSGTSVRCGSSPLFLGQDASCAACGKLACAKCGHCDSACAECKRRQDAIM